MGNYIENDIYKIIKSNEKIYKLPYLNYSSLDDILFNTKDPEEKYPYLIEVNKNKIYFS
jgi:hypothetical protein